MFHCEGDIARTAQNRVNLFIDSYLKGNTTNDSTISDDACENGNDQTELNRKIKGETSLCKEISLNAETILKNCLETQSVAQTSKELYECFMYESAEERLLALFQQVLESQPVQSQSVQSLKAQPKPVHTQPVRYLSEGPLFVNCRQPPSHKVKSRPVDDQQLYSCRKCVYKSKLKWNLQSHQLIHTVEKPYHCSRCPFKSKWKASLATHTKKHDILKPYKCPTCDFRARSKTVLIHHRKSHFSKKRFKST